MAVLSARLLYITLCYIFIKNFVVNLNTKTKIIVVYLRAITFKIYRLFYTKKVESGLGTQ